MIMKRILSFLLFIAVIAGGARSQWYKTSPQEYMWTNVGKQGFSAGSVFIPILAFSPSGNPYVAYIDAADSMKVTVMQYDGTNWVNVGNTGFSANEGTYLGFAFSPSGEPWVAYVNNRFPFRVTVMKFDGSTWTNVGVETSLAE